MPGQRESAGGAGEPTRGAGEAVPPGCREAEEGEGGVRGAAGGVPAEFRAAQGGSEDCGERAREAGEPGEAAADL